MADSYIDELVNVSLLKIVQDRGFVQVGQAGHILGLLVLGWVDLLEQIFLDSSLLGSLERTVIWNVWEWKGPIV